MLAGWMVGLCLLTLLIIDLFSAGKAFVLGLANKGNSKVAVKGMEEASRQVLIKLEVDSPRTWVILVFFWSKFAPH